MSDSKELDKYGVWVKNSPKDIKGDDSDMPENAIDDIDLPSDDDMFNDIEFPMTAEDLKDDSSNSDISDIDIDIDIPAAEEESPADDNADTTLSADELMNITSDQEIPAEEAPADDGMDDFNIDDLDITSGSGEIAEESPVQEEAVPDIDIPSVEEPAAESQEVSLDDIPDGEIDLDDFMSDSGSGGGDSAPDGDVDLSAFMDGDDGDVDLSAFMDDAPSSKKEAAPEEIQDEKSLDIDVSFDDSADEIVMEDASAESEPAPAEETPAESGDDMFSEFGGEAVVQKAASTESASSSVADDSEEIDLSDFGFDDDDSNIGMTNGPDGANAPKKEVVDYDMKVSADDDSKTPSVQDVISGNVESAEEEAEDTMVSNEESAVPAASPEISQKGQEILSQIMGELSNLKDEIKNLKSDFAELKDRPTPAAGSASFPAAQASPEKEEDTGFFGADDGDDTIALSGNELTNILSNAEISTEEAVEDASEEPVEEPSVVENPENEIEESSIESDELKMDFSEADMQEPTIDTTEITPEDLAGTTDEFGEENILPEEISVPKIDDDITVESSSSDLMDSVVNTDENVSAAEEPLQEEAFNAEAFDEILKEDPTVSESLDEEKIEYMEQDSDLDKSDEDVVSVDDIVRQNVSLQEDKDNVSVGVGDDINAAFDEADAIESDIAATALAEKDAYENSVSDIMKENISLQEDSDDVSVSVGDDINAAFDEADATESDIADDALAEKDAYENSKSLDEEFSLDIGDESEEAVPETLDESILAQNADEPAIDDVSIDETIDEAIFDQEPAVEETLADEAVFEEASVEEPALDEPIVEETVVDEPIVEKTIAAAPAASSEKTTISKDLKSEIVSVLSYMDQLLENLPEEKITEFAKSEHFVTYKKLFDELGLS